MQRKKYTEEQIIQVLTEGEAGRPVVNTRRTLASVYQRA